MKMPKYDAAKHAEAKKFGAELKALGYSVLSVGWTHAVVFIMRDGIRGPVMVAPEQRDAFLEKHRPC